MTVVRTFKCNKCDFSFKGANIYGFVAYDDNGNRYSCNARPDKVAETISKVFNLSPEIAEKWANFKNDEVPEDIRKKLADNTGMESLFICLNCLAENYIYVRRDKLRCSKCNSVSIMSPYDCCPKCREGKIEAEGILKPSDK